MAAFACLGAVQWYMLLEVAVNPKVVVDWTYSGLGAGRSTHFHLLKAAP
jgi:hypothetical protein